MTLTNFDYNGQLIQRRQSDGFINLTQMCAANGKKISHFLSLASTKNYIAQIESDDGITASQLLIVKKGNSLEFTQGTWGHPEIAILLAQWISPKFHRWCNAHIFNLMETGQTSLDIDPIEEMKLKIELAKIERDKEMAIAQSKQADFNLISLRNTITKTCPESVQQKVFGYQVVEVEKRTVYRDNDLVRDGSTISKTELCYRYGFISKAGKPDYRKLAKYLTITGVGNGCDKDNPYWQPIPQIREGEEFKREYLTELDRLLLSERVERQVSLGE